MTIILISALFSVDANSAEGETATTAQKSNQMVISGIICDEEENPLIGVSVQIEGTTAGTFSDMDGRYSLPVPDKNAVLVFSYLGMNQQAIPVNGRRVINVTLADDVQSIEEVVVVGYGQQKKATVTGAISSVGSKELIQSAQANISNSLVGRMSGLIAVQKSGEPGRDQSIIRIRGIGSFADAYDSDLQNPLVMVDGIEVSNYNNISPNEIENVSILKDASATAVYGVRGANGVVLITTKRGALGRPKINFSTSYAITSFTNLRKNMNAYDWAREFNNTRKYDGYLTGNYEPKFTEEELEKFRTHSDPVFYPDTDWVKMMFKDRSHQSQHNISIRGGTEKVKYFASLGYFSQGGLYNNTNIVPDYDSQVTYDRYNFRTNFDFQVSKRLSIVLNVSDQMEYNKRPEQSAEYMLANAFAHPPTSGPGLVDGMVIENLEGRYNFIYNPLKGFFIAHGGWKIYSNQLNASGRVNYDLDFITPGLSMHAVLSYQNWNNHGTHYTKSVKTYKAIQQPDGTASFIPQGKDAAFGTTEQFDQRRRNYLEAGIDYMRSFGNHRFGSLLLYNQSKDYNPNLKFKIPNAYLGVVGRITYDYGGKYLAEFNMGYNGTENFAKGNRFGFFPAFSAGWVLTEEKFVPKNDIVTFAKIRGSYGEVGNDKIGGDRFLYLPTAYVYETADGNNNDNVAYWFGTISDGSYNKWAMTASEGKLGNPELTWEKAKKMNIGADIQLWSDRIRISADYFRETRDNILTTKGTTPVIVAADMPAYNLGKMRNHGFDGDITFRDRVSSLNYWVKGIFTFARNKIIEMDEVQRAYPYLQRTGKPFEQYFGLIAEGFYNTWEEVNDVNRPVSSWNGNKLQPGDVKYRDINGDGIINEDDMGPIGYSRFPEISYGFSFGGDFKNFDFSVLFQGSARSSYQASSKMRQGWSEDGSAIDYLKDWSWTQERYENGEEIKLPHVSADPAQRHNYQNSTLWIRDAKYLRLKNVEVGYTLTGNFLKKLGLDSARIYVSGTNLLTWSGLWPGEDPEIPSYNDGNYEPYPIVKLVNMGLNINF